MAWRCGEMAFNLAAWLSKKNFRITFMSSEVAMGSSAQCPFAWLSNGAAASDANAQVMFKSPAPLASSVSPHQPRARSQLVPANV